MRLPALLLSVLIFLLCAPIAAEEIRPGVKYTGPKTLGIERIGVSFKLPAGWEGTLPQGEDTFVIGKVGSEGYVFVVAEEATLDEAKAAMSKALPIDQLVMTPKGAARVAGNTITNDYTVTGGQKALVGKAAAKVGVTGWGVMVLAIATPNDMPTFSKVAAGIANSIKIVNPPKPKVAKGSTKGYWGKMFAGKRIVRFFTGSGYSEQTQILMCPNGRFVYRFDGGGFSMDGFSGAMQSKNGGAWSTTGTAAGGTLVLSYNDGRSATYQLSEVDGKLMLDGGRWLREAINCN